MAVFPVPSEIQSVYLQVLKSIKPTLNINDANSDFVIRGKAISGLISGLYGDQSKINADTFVTTARPEALVSKGLDLGLALQSATQATSTGVSLTGPNGTVVAAGDLQFLYEPTNLFYVNTTGGTFNESGSLTVAVQCQVTGSLGNVQAPDTLILVNPPAGVNASATIVRAVAGGSDVESYDSFRSRILARQQYTPAGGNEADYKSWGFMADPSVRSVSIRRFIKGLGTVGVVITSGVTDIDQAVTAGVPVVRIPSAQVVANVQAYYDSHAPLTDCPTVFGPVETPVDVTMQVSVVAPFTLASIPSDPVNNPNNLTIEALVQREVGRALYKAAIGGRQLTGQTGGFIVASDIEANIDYWLSAAADPATGLVRGRIPVLNDRQILPLNGTMYDLPISANSLARPGNVVVVSGVS